MLGQRMLRSWGHNQHTPTVEGVLWTRAWVLHHTHQGSKHTCRCPPCGLGMRAAYVSGDATLQEPQQRMLNELCTCFSSAPPVTAKIRTELLTGIKIYQQPVFKDHQPPAAPSTTTRSSAASTNATEKSKCLPPRAPHMVCLKRDSSNHTQKLWQQLQHPTSNRRIPLSNPCLETPGCARRCC